MWKNIDPKSKFGEEIFKLINWEITNNMSTSTARRKEQLKYDEFSKIVNPSCIIKEIRDVIFGFGIVDVGLKKERAARLNRAGSV